MSETQGPGGTQASAEAAMTIDRRGFVIEMRRAMQLHEAGKLHEAAAAYQRALACHPDQPEALNYSGYLAHQLGESARGLEAIRRSIALDGDNPHFINNLAKVQQALGRPAEAAESYRRALALNPSDAQAQFNLGIVLQAQGELSEAQRCFWQAAALNKQDPRPLINLGNILRQRGRMRKAAGLYRRALELDPDDTLAMNNLGATLKALGRPEKAMTWFRRSLAVDPDNARTQCELGALLAEQGRDDDAVAAYRRAMQIDPQLGTPYLYLSRVKRFAPDDADLATMEALLSDPDANEETAIDLHFALGKAYEDLGSYDVAFRQFAEGNRLKHKSVSFDAAAVTASCERIMATFDAALFERNRGAGSDSELPIFIVGMPRSGSSLVEQILASHPAVYGAGEVPDLRLFAGELPRRIESDAPFPACVEDVAVEDWRGLGAAFETRLRSYDPAAQRITDKMLGNFRFVGLAHLLFPRARIVHCLRDPMDLCLSCYKLQFPGGFEFAYDLGDLGQMYRIYQRCMEHWNSLLPGRLFELRYEELVDDLEGGVRRLLEHCGLPWDEACLRFYDSDRAVHTSSAAQVKQPLYRDSVGAWRNYEAHLAPLKAALGQAR